jgi:hypothetical protein
MMDYLEYFRKFPDMYAKVVSKFDREHSLYDFIVDSGIVDNVETLLSIGPGDGLVEVRLARERGVKLGLIEPSTSLFDQMMRNSTEAGVDAQIVEARKDSFEHYTVSQPYDLVLSLFSWFAFEFDRSVLEKALHCTKRGGKLLICIQDAASPSTRISALSRSGGINLTSENLSEWARNEGFDHQMETYHGKVPAEVYLDGQQLAEGGCDLTSFLLATPWDEISDEHRSLAWESFEAARRGDAIDFSAGCLIFSC